MICIPAVVVEKMKNNKNQICTFKKIIICLTLTCVFDVLIDFL